MFMPYAGMAQTPTPASTPVPPTISVCPYDNVIMRPGSTGSEVKALQSLLAQDTAVYPQGLTTGYYGNLTQEAVKRLQQRAGLSQTGIVDSDTRQIIFPCVTLRVVSPNGGEAWRVGEERVITWEVTAPVYIQNPSAVPGARLQTLAPTAAATALPEAIRPFYPHLSIDLIKLDGPQVLVYPAPVFYHIGSTSLYGEKSFKWIIPNTIPESKAYKVRISVWKEAPQPAQCELLTYPPRPCPKPEIYPIPWRGHLWDESDAEFAILGGVAPSPTPRPTPTPTNRPELLELRVKVASMIEQLQKMLQLIDELLGRIPAL